VQLKKLFDHISISSKLSLLIASLIFLTFLLLWLIINNTLIHLLNAQTDMLGENTAHQMAHASAELLLAEDLLSLKVIVNQVSQADNIARAQIRNTNNQILADSSGADAASPGHSLTQRLSPQHILYSAPIVFQGVTAGHADVLLDKSMIASTIERTLRWMSAAFGVLLTLSLPLSYLLGRYWAEPIKQLILATHAVNAGELKTRLSHARQDEFGALMNSFNEMADSLAAREQLKSTFYRYVGSGIANQVLDEPNNPVVPLRPITATVVFFDIVSFTQLCEKMSPESIGKVLTHYYDCVTRCCAEFGGIIDKFMGDGALVIFGASGDNNNHVRNAILASALFLKRSNQKTKATAYDKRTALSYRISIHTGNMLAGTLGEQERLQYTVIGDTVNVAARLCQQATPDEPVISCASRAYLPDQETPYLKPLGLWAVRGRTSGINAYQIIGKQLPPSWIALVNQRARLLSQQTGTSQAPSRQQTVKPVTLPDLSGENPLVVTLLD
jgi:adenylate cyclase